MHAFHEYMNVTYWNIHSTYAVFLHIDLPAACRPPCCISPPRLFVYHTIYEEHVLSDDDDGYIEKYYTINACTNAHRICRKNQIRINGMFKLNGSCVWHANIIWCSLHFMLLSHIYVFLLSFVIVVVVFFCSDQSKRNDSVKNIWFCSIFIFVFLHTERFRLLRSTTP